jgi:dihydroneopterin aldolase
VNNPAARCSLVSSFFLNPMSEEDCISIHDLTVPSHVGVPDGELALLQTLMVTLHLYPKAPLTGLGDDIERTIDYDAVCRYTRRLALDRPRRLLETLGEELTAGLFTEFPLIGRCIIDIHKSIIPGTRSVCVRISRQRHV